MSSSSRYMNTGIVYAPYIPITTCSTIYIGPNKHTTGKPIGEKYKGYNIVESSGTLWKRSGRWNVVYNVEYNQRKDWFRWDTLESVRTQIDAEEILAQTSKPHNIDLDI